MKVRVLFLAVAVALGVTGCAANGQQGGQEQGQTVSRPEVQIKASSDRVKSELVGRLTKAGFDLEDEGQFKLTFSKPITDLKRIMSLTLQGVNSSASKRDIIDFTVTENSGETTVIATQFVGLENAFGKQLKFEEKYQNEAHESIQNSLEKMKKEMEKP